MGGSWWCTSDPGGGAGSDVGRARLVDDSRERMDRIDAIAAGWPPEATIRVLPRGGRLVVFDSKLIHEVGVPSCAQPQLH